MSEGWRDELIELRRTQGDALRALLGEHRPFGPHEMDQVRSPALYEFFYDERANGHQEEVSLERSMFILGRRGSGKTTLLNQVLTKRTNLVISLQSEEIFPKVSELILLFPTQDPELVAQVWSHVAWVAAIAELGKRKGPRDLQVYSDAIRRLMTGAPAEPTIDDLVLTYLSWIASQVKATGLTMTVRSTLNSLSLDGVSFEGARSHAQQHLREHSHSVAVLFDSLERFPAEFEKHHAAIEGLMKYIGSLASRPAEGMIVRCCFPAEMYRELVALSSNRSKDLWSTFRLEWTSREIVTLVARRFCKFAQLWILDHPSETDKVRPELLNEPDGFASALSYLEVLMPEVRNRVFNTVNERSPIYLMRHTHLLPRQYILLIQGVVAGFGARRTLMGERVPADVVVSKVREVERGLSEEIVGAHRSKYPDGDLIEVVKCVCRDLPLVFGRTEFRKAFDGVPKHKRIKLDHEQALDLFLSIGCVGGRVHETLPYQYAEFGYTLTEYEPAHDQQLCLHPLFSGLASRTGQPGGKPIFPVGADF